MADIGNKKYDLQGRTAKFAENVIDFVRLLENNAINRPLISQIVRSSSSIGANYMEADVAESKKDFEHKIGISRKEAKETHHWLRLIQHANKQTEIIKQSQILSKESWELVLIFSSIIKNSKTNSESI